MRHLAAPTSKEYPLSDRIGCDIFVSVFICLLVAQAKAAGMDLVAGSICTKRLPEWLLPATGAPGRRPKAASL